MLALKHQNLLPIDGVPIGYAYKMWGYLFVKMHGIDTGIYPNKCAKNKNMSQRDKFKKNTDSEIFFLFLLSETNTIADRIMFIIPAKNIVYMNCISNSIIF